MATIYLPARMRSFAGSKAKVEVSGSTIRELIESLLAIYPKIEGQLLDNSQSVSKHTKVFINGTDISQLQYEDSTVDKNDSVHIVQTMTVQ